MPTLKAVRREMVMRERALGRVEAVSSLTATTVVVARLGGGTFIPANAYANRFLVRADATNTADRERLIKTSIYTAGAGMTFTHDGTNYADTGSTGELVEILRDEPGLIDSCIYTALGKVRRLDRTEIPTNSGSRYWLDPVRFPWLTDVSHISHVTLSQNPVLNMNRYMEKWNTIDSTGTLTPPDGWTLTGTNATVARSTTQQRRGHYAAAITRAGTDCTLSQDVGLLWDGVTGDSIRGQAIAAAAWVWSSTASQVRLQVDDGVTTTSSSFHTGGSGWEELTLTKTVASTATQCKVQISVATSNNVVYTDDVWVAYASAVDDTIRRDVWDEQAISPVYDTAATPIAMVDNPQGRGRQYAVYSSRPYPQFDFTRLVAGTADADSTDAPLVTLAVAALAEYWEGKASDDREDQGKARKAARWREQADELMGAHTYRAEPNPPGLRVLRGSPVPRITRPGF